MIEQDEVLPTFSKDLIALLDRAYPHKCIAPGETIESAQRYAAKRELIDELIELREEAAEEEIARAYEDQNRG